MFSGTPDTPAHRSIEADQDGRRVLVVAAGPASDDGPARRLRTALAEALATGEGGSWTTCLDEARKRVLAGKVDLILADASYVSPEEVERLVQASGARLTVPLVCFVPEEDAVAEHLLGAGVTDVLHPADLEVPGRGARILAGTLAERLTLAQREAETFRTLAENLTETLVIMSASGEIHYCSPSFEAFSGVPAAEAVGRNALEFILSEDRPHVRASLQMIFEGTHPPGPIQFRIAAPGGEVRILEASGENLLEEPSVQGIVVSFRDVTERIGIEERLRGSQKVEAVGRLAGGIAHDFNNILTALGGSTEMLLEDVGPEGPIAEELLEIRKGIQRAAALTSRLLAYGRQQIMQLRRSELGEVVRGVEPLVSRVLESHIEVVLDIVEDGPVRVDVNQLEQVILNLVINSRDAMPFGGTLTLSVDRAHLDASDTARHGFEIVPGPYMRLTVTDTGTGVPQALIHRIFEPFFTTKPPGAGSGLGLAMAYGFVKQSRGYILAESRPGEGTAMRIYLPMVPGSEGEPGETPY